MFTKMLRLLRHSIFFLKNFEIEIFIELLYLQKICKNKFLLTLWKLNMIFNFCFHYIFKHTVISFLKIVVNKIVVIISKISSTAKIWLYHRFSIKKTQILEKKILKNLLGLILDLFQS